MTATSEVTIAGLRAVSAVLTVPPTGPWWLDATLDGADDVSGRVTVQIGDSLTLSGTASTTGVFATTRSVRVVAGAGAWGSLVGPASLHNDAGVAALTAAQAVAAAAGETIGDFAPEASTLPVDFVRTSGLASRALEQIIGSASWWVGYDGTTVVGSRSTSTPSTSAYELLSWDPIDRVAVIGADDLATIGVGSVLAANDRMPEAQTVREVRVEIEGGVATIRAWCGELDGGPGRLARAVLALARRGSDTRIPYPLRYRVLSLSDEVGTRVSLQAVSPGAPDIGPISMAPGVAGAHSALAVGAIVLVAFVEGLPTLPFVVGFAGKDGQGWTPTSTTLDASTSGKLGEAAISKIALAPTIDSQFNAINAALDAFAAATPVPNDGGAALHTAFVGSWGVGVPPKPSSNVGASKWSAE